MYQFILSLGMFSVFGNRHGWLIPDNVRQANSFVLLSADWPSDFAVENAQCHFVLIHPRISRRPRLKCKICDSPETGMHSSLFSRLVESCLTPGPFLLTQLLSDYLVQTAAVLGEARVVNVTCGLHDHENEWTARGGACACVCVRVCVHEPCVCVV